MSKRRGWRFLAVSSWLVFFALVASPLATEYGLIRPVPDGEAKGALLLLGMLAFLVSIISTIASFPSNAEETRKEEIREHAHTRQCTRGPRCNHPDHVHPVMRSGIGS